MFWSTRIFFRETLLLNPSALARHCYKVYTCFFWIVLMSWNLFSFSTSLTSEKEKSCRFEDLGSEEVAGQKSWHCWPEISEKCKVGRRIVVVEKPVSIAPLDSLFLPSLPVHSAGRWISQTFSILDRCHSNFLTSKTNQMLEFCSLFPLWKWVPTFPKFL
jgi:hypothetical protein